MSCCQEMLQGQNDELMVFLDKSMMADGRIMNEVDSEYYLRINRSDGSYAYYAIAYCPFCGRPISSAVQGFRG